MSMFRCATFLFAVAKVYLFLHSANFSLFFFEEQSKILGSTGKSVSAGELDNNRTYGFTLDFFSTTDWTDGTDTGPVRAIRQKHNKPLAVDADVSYEPRMLWLSGNPSSKLGYFLPATPSHLRVFASIARR